MMGYYKDDNHKYKQVSNCRLTDWAGRYVNKRSRKALILDGPNQYTAQALGTIMKSKNIISVNTDNSVIINAQKLQSAIGFHTTIYKYLKYQMKKIPNIIYLDYMSTIYGNKKNKLNPLKDIKLLFKKCIKKHKRIVFAVTFSQRIKKLLRDNNGTRQDAKTSTITELFNLIISSGYIIKKFEVMPYSKGHGAMIHIIYILQHR